MKRFQPFPNGSLVVVRASDQLRTFPVAYGIDGGGSGFEMIDGPADRTRPAQRDPFDDGLIRDQQLQNPEAVGPIP